MKKWVALAVTLLLMAVVFGFSAQPGQDSARLSGAVAQKMQDNKAAESVTPALFSANVNANLRKWAHVYIYCALGISTAVTVSLFLRTSRRASWRKERGLYGRAALLSVAFCTLYAATDELHQFFVPDRAALLSDIGVDALGFLPCILLTCLLLWLWRRHSPPKKETQNKKD